MLDHSRLKALLHYCRATGLFTWIAKPSLRSNRVTVGAVAGSARKDGYLVLRLDGRIYLQHRLAWFYVHGVWPPSTLDHKNLNRGDNRLCNLRCATNGENSRNGPMRSNNNSGFKGVSFHKRSGKYRARIRLNRKEITIGYFDTPEKAHSAYCTASKELHGSFGRTQ